MDRKFQIEKKVFDFIEEKGLLSEKDTVILGLSGGADSVCLLRMLLKFRAYKMPAPSLRHGACENGADHADATEQGAYFHIIACHVHHGLRENADADEAFVRALCEAYGVPCVVEHADVAALAKAAGCSVEEAGRKVRYEAFAKVGEAYAAGVLPCEMRPEEMAPAKSKDFAGESSYKIATAHHANDRAETFLFNLLRGGGLKGLSSLAPKRDNIIRPLLCLERAEIEEYLTLIQQPYCTDETNASDAYTRNRIRHHLLPEAVQICPGSVGNINKTAAQLAELEDYVSMQVERAKRSCTDKIGDKIYVDVHAFSNLHPAIGKGLLLALLNELSPKGQDIGAVHVADVFSLFEKGKTGKEIHLPYLLTAKRERTQVLLYITKEGKKLR